MEYATWFGRDDFPLFGVVHVPLDMRARGAVVICSAVGKEHVNTYRGIKQLAEMLCDSGALVLRFDYAGHGDSGGEQAAPDAVSRWCDSIVEAVNYVRSAGLDDVTLVGLRLGALLAATIAPQCSGLRNLVLWDPVLSGRNYVREQRALYRLSIDARESLGATEHVALLGVELHQAAIAQLAALSLDTVDSDCLRNSRVLIAARNDVRDTASLGLMSEQLGAAMQFLQADHEAFVSPPGFVLSVASTSIAALANNIQSAFDANFRDVAPTIRTENIAIDAHGRRRIEHLRYHGEDRLFAIHVAPEDASGPTVIFHGTASEHRIGPTRLWVEVARELASRGIASVRFDRRYIGDSGSVAINEATPSYAPSDRADAREIARAVGLPPSQLLFAGLCSGGWHAGAIARELGARAAVMISTVEWSMRRHVRISPDPIELLDEGLGSQAPGLVYRARVYLKSLQYLLPYALWRRLGIWRLVKVPEVMLEALWQGGVRTTTILTPNDYRWFRLQRGDEGLQRLRQRGYADALIVCEQGDHSLYGHEVREFVRAELMRAIATAFSAAGDVRSNQATDIVAAVPAQVVYL